MSRRATAAAAVLAAAIALLVSASPGGSATLSPKLRPDLAALVAGEAQLDARIPPLVPGYVAGEIPYFVALSAPDDDAHSAQITALGGRVLRAYGSFNAFAVGSSPAVVESVAALPWVTWLAPVEVVTTLDDAALADQTRGTSADVGASPLWSQGLTGAGVKIAVLDTGIDPTHPDLDDLDFHRWSQLLNPTKVTATQNFVGSTCSPTDTQDRNGHGTHVSGIASGTGEGSPTDDPHGRYVGIAPDATLVAGKVFTDGGIGLNSD